MINNKLNKYILGLAVLCACAVSCEPEPVQTRFYEPEETLERAEMQFGISLQDAGGATKASLLRDVESTGSGALVLVYRSATRRLDSYRYFTEDELRHQEQVPLRLRVPLTECDFYILGNLNAVGRADGRPTHLMEALGASFPVDESALEAWVYRLDGGDLNGQWRRQTFAEVAAFGIPYMHVSKGLDVAAQVRQGQGIPGADRCRRLFSKVTLRIDHAAFDGGGAQPGLFVNMHLYLRQANGRLQPFSEVPQRASEAVDVLASADYDPDMTTSNASVTTFSFYVPENMQGDLLPDNTDSRNKTLDELVRRGRQDVAPRLTYVEFTGRLDPAAGGYGGDVTYRFYPGADNCRNFDLERNREYDITLTFRVGSLFEPDWKVEPSNWSDGRLFCLTGDAAFTDRLPEGRLLAVRRNRPGAVYVYMDPQAVLGGPNALRGKDFSPSAAFVPASVADCAWYGGLMVPGDPDRAWLAARGITPAWDPAACRLSFAVTDATRFGAHLGEARTLSLRLLPAGGTVTFELRLLPDIGVSVAGGLSLTEDFYLGQRRTVTVSGFAGSTVCYAADQDPCGRSGSGTPHTANVQWKAATASDAAYPGCAVDAAGRVVLDVSDPAYASQRCGGTLDVYAYYPNRFLPAHGGWVSKDGRIIFFSEDALNDSFEVPVRISEPRLHVTEGEQHLPIDGNEVRTEFGYWKSDGSERLPASSFDPVLLQTRLGFGLRSRTGAPYSAWASCLALDPATGEMYVRQTTSSAGNLEEGRYELVNGAYSRDLASWQLDPLVLDDLYGDSPGFRIRVTKLQIRNIKNGFHTSHAGTQGDTGESILYVGYFNTNTASGTDEQLTEDTQFSVSANYHFVHGDLSRISWTRSGEATTYTCRRAPYETFAPVVDFVVDEEDDGNGGTLSWVYDETHQVRRSSSGEPVPGGLVIPYGNQGMTGTYSNKWDHRTFSVRVGFTLTYPVINASILVVARPGARYASVYLMPQKIIKYLKALGPSVDTAARHWMMQLFNDSRWMNNVRFEDCYQVRPGWNQYHRPGPQTGSPRSDYDIKYLWEYLYNHTNVDSWTQNAVNLVESTNPTLASAIARTAFVEGYVSDHFTTLSNSSSVARGIWWTKPESF